MEETIEERNHCNDHMETHYLYRLGRELNILFRTRSIDFLCRLGHRLRSVRLFFSVEIHVFMSNLIPINYTKYNPKSEKTTYDRSPVPIADIFLELEPLIKLYTFFFQFHANAFPEINSFCLVQICVKFFEEIPCMWHQLLND